MQKGQKRNKFIANDFGERKHEQNYLETRNHAGSGAAGTDFLRNGRKTERNDCSLDRHYQQRTADDLRVNQAVTFSHGLIKDSGEFVINLTTLPLAEAADFCGVKSGRDTDKFQAMHLTAAPCAKVKAPQVAESPVSIECKVKSIVNYGTHDMFLAEIVAVNVDDTYINDKGRLDLEKAGLVAYAHGHYYTLGRNLGGFGFSVNKERLKKRQKTQKEKNERASVVRTAGRPQPFSVAKPAASKAPRKHYGKLKAARKA